MPAVLPPVSDSKTFLQKLFQLTSLLFLLKFSRDIREATPSLDGAKAPGVNIFAGDDFMETGGGDDDMGMALF